MGDIRSGRRERALGTMSARLALVAWLVVALAACDDAGSPEHDFAAAWRSAGASVSTFTKVEDSPIGGQACWSGEVDDIETLFCQYQDAKAAAKAQPSGLRHVGEHTGVAIHRGRWMIVAIDRENRDPSGKALNRLAKTFLSHKRMTEGAAKKPSEDPPGGDESKAKNKASKKKSK